MGAERTELLDGQLYWPGNFDERDAMVARRALPGSRIRVEPGVGLSAGPMLEDEPTSREWTDEDGTRWREMNGLTLFQRPGGRNWTMRSPTPEERRHNAGQLAAYRAEGWAGTVAAYAGSMRTPHVRRLGTSSCPPRVRRAVDRLGLPIEQDTSGVFHLTEEQVGELARELGVIPLVPGMSRMDAQVLAALSRSHAAFPRCVKPPGGQGSVPPLRDAR